jgi:hypothetical protein
MAIVDDRGRVFGRFNPVDVFVFALVVIMIPVAYGAYALFRTPPAKLTGVEPKQFTMGPNLRVRVNGTNLRPFMRISFNTVQGRTFMIGSTETAEVDLPDLEPGTYDIVLYDYAQEMDRLPKALTILPRVSPPEATVSVEGVFVGVSEGQAKGIRAGMSFERLNQQVAKVLAIAPRSAGSLQMRTGPASIAVGLPGVFDVPAALQLQCSVENNSDGSVRCTVYGPIQPALVAPDSVLLLPLNGGTISFQITDVQSSGQPTFLRVRVHAQVGADVVRQWRVGDSDSSLPDYPGAWRGRVESVNGGDVVLRVPAQQLITGWRYRGQWLKVGGSIRFETSSSLIGGTIAELTPIEGRPRP